MYIIYVCIYPQQVPASLDALSEVTALLSPPSQVTISMLSCSGHWQPFEAASTQPTYV